ncbi:hypothetical protein [Variovorax sp. EL159]|uniref:hypothetical protein n=1 Tax=Variovorax sp. EL159 TaxID=1566270 RepID=UPI0008912714|nr:hypothetical protein [Variovorax sp. EL159]SCX52859.1 hypothetical protein SAMN03159363_1266 [Variovorax sp. EL159]
MKKRKWAERSSLERTTCTAVLLSALRNLHKVCLDMELEREDKRPSEAQYQHAMRHASAAIAMCNGSAS